MIYTEAKARIEELLDNAKKTLEMDGITVTTEIEVIENKITDTESEPLAVLGSIALSAEGLTEDDTYYISIEAKIEAGEVSSEALEEAIPGFMERVNSAQDRLSAAEDKTATLVEMGKEVDEEIERRYAEEALKRELAMKRDLKLALFGTGAIILFVILMVILSKIF